MGCGLACDGLWKVFSGSEAVAWLDERLPRMDARRRELAATLENPAACAALKDSERAALKAEREVTCEEGCLKAMLQEAVSVRHAKDNVTVLLLRF